MRCIFVKNRYGQPTALNFDLRQAEENKTRKMILGVIQAATTAKNERNDGFFMNQKQKREDRMGWI